MNSDVKLDCFGLLCPMPIIATARKMKELKVGQVLEVTATDEGIKTDMPAWCLATGQEYLGLQSNDGEYHVFVKKVKE
jgi:tRNA 2-thiouridine synthesizing protein A